MLASDLLNCARKTSFGVSTFFTTAWVVISLSPLSTVSMNLDKAYYGRFALGFSKLDKLDSAI